MSTNYCALLLDMAEGYVQQPCIWVEGAAGVLLTLTLLECSSLMQLRSSESSSIWCVHGDLDTDVLGPNHYVSMDADGTLAPLDAYNFAVSCCWNKDLGTKTN